MPFSQLPNVNLLARATVLMGLAAITCSAAQPLRTIQNLNMAYQGETNASNRYQAFSKKADQEGYHQVAKLFRAISYSESVHRDNHKAAIQTLGGRLEAFNPEQPEVKNTRENLERPLHSERNESDELYPQFMKEATIDNAEIAYRSFKYAMEAEAQHYKLFKNALDELGHNHAADYYVSKVSGDTLEAAPDKRPENVSNLSDYVKIDSLADAEQ